MLHILAFQSAVLLFGGKHILFYFFKIYLHFPEHVTGQDKLMQGNRNAAQRSSTLQIIEALTLKGRGLGRGLCESPA